MFWLTRRFPLMAQAGEDTGGGGGGADTQPGAQGADTQPAGGGDDKVLSGPALVEAMGEAIKEGMEGEGGPQGEPAKPAPKAEAGGSPSEPLKPEAKTAEQIEADRVKAEKDAHAALLTKKPEDFKLSDADKAAMKPASQARFQELITWGKAHHERAAKLEADLTAQQAANNDILASLDDARCTPDDFVALMRLNKAIKTGDVDTALKMVEATRRHLMTLAGIEGDGVDLLAPFPDLQKKVEDELMDRAAALEVAKARRIAAGAQRAQQATQQRQTQQQARQQASEQAVAGIEQWCAAKAKADPDYKRKEAALIPKIKGIMDKYPVEQWQATIELLYDNIALPQAQSTRVGSDVTPTLRPGGTPAGSKAPSTMFDAISQGLGYSN